MKIWIGHCNLLKLPPTPVHAETIRTDLHSNHILWTFGKNQHENLIKKALESFLLPALG